MLKGGTAFLLKLAALPSSLFKLTIRLDLAFRPNILRDHFYDQSDPQRQQDQVIQEPQHRNEIRNQVNRREYIHNDHDEQRFWQKRHSRIFAGEGESLLAIALFDHRMAQFRTIAAFAGPQVMKESLKMVKIEQITSG
jgi:hypothetical protein